MRRQPSPIYVDDRAGHGRTRRKLVTSRGSDFGQPPESAEPLSGKRRIAFGWYGGKFTHLGWIYTHLPEARHYCEPFGGSAAVLINRRPAAVETYNDIDGEVVNFFRVLRDDADELVRRIALTPFSREEFFEAISQAANDGDNGQIVEPDESPIERARCFFIRARQVRTGLAQTATLGRWANCKQTSRSGMSGAVSRWLGSVDGLPEIADRLLRVQIENRPAEDVIRLYDHADTLFYCDPPYPHASRGDTNAYGHEMTDEQHESLATLLRGVKGKVALSGYRCDLLDTLYANWRREDAPTKRCHSSKRNRTEAIWLND